MRRAVAQRPGHRATTATLQAVYPFAAQAGLGGRGIYIGRDLYGGSFAYDPFTLYERRILTNPNMLVIGEVGSGKSSLVKSYLLRQALFGRIPWVSDPKGEYAVIARALGCEPIRLAPGGQARVNPIADRADPEGQLALLQAISAATLGRPLDSEERAALREALRVLDGVPRDEPTLPRIVDLLLHPIADMADRLATTPTRLGLAVRDLALGLQRLCDGELRGMFDAPTSAGLSLDGRAVVLDLSAFYESSSLGIVMTCAAAWQRGAMVAAHRRADRTGAQAPKFINVFDEAWRAISLLGVGEWLQDSFKKSRAYGLQNIVVMHRLSDLQAAGDSGSRQVALAEGLLHDAQTRVVYRQARDEVPRTEQVLGLSRLEADLIPELAPGVALWRVGTRTFLVQHRLSEIEAPLVDTDGRMREQHLT
jgi:hypothetical protein